MLHPLLFAPSSDPTDNIENQLHSLIGAYWGRRGFRSSSIMRRMGAGMASVQNVEDVLRKAYNAPSQYDLEVQFWEEASDEAFTKVRSLLEEEE